METFNLVKVTCPNCGAPIEEKQLKMKTIRCFSCNQTFQRNDSLEKENDSQPLYLPPALSDEDCKLLIIRDLVFTDNVPVDIFDTLEIEVQTKKFHPFYVYHLDWWADWSATCSMTETYEVPNYDYSGGPFEQKKKTKTRTHYRDYNGTSKGNSLVVIGGGQKDDLFCTNELCDHYNAHNVRELFFTKAEEYNSIPDDWTKVEAKTAEEVSNEQNKQIEEALGKIVIESVYRDAAFMASGWKLENCHFTSDYRQIKNPDCVFRPIWEMKCNNNNVPFNAAIDTSQKTIFQNAPQNNTEKEKLKELDVTIDKYDKSVIPWFLAFLFIFILGIFLGIINPTLFIVLLFSIIFLGLSIHDYIALKNAKEEKKTILSNSVQKRKAAALRRFGSNPKLVELIESVQKNQDKE